MAELFWKGIEKMRSKNKKAAINAAFVEFR